MKNVATNKKEPIIVSFLWSSNNHNFHNYYMNLEKNHNSGVVINPTILPARNRNIPFAIPIPNLI